MDKNLCSGFWFCGLRNKIFKSLKTMRYKSVYWITDDANLSHIQIEGYTFISNQSIVGRKGGLITFLNNKYNSKTLSHQNLSTIWEGQFLEINGFELNKKLLLGNLFRPPRNSQENYNINRLLYEYGEILTRVSIAVTCRDTSLRVSRQC